LPKKTFEAAKASGVHLIVQLKDNQPALYRKVEACCRNGTILSGHRTVDHNKRNRHETRIIGVLDASLAVAGTEWEPYVKAIIQVERTVHTRNAATGLWKTSTETAFYLSNRPIHARKAARKIRDHWAIENRQHYVRDVTMAEDASRIRVNPGIFARLRSFAYNILRFNQSDTIAQDRFAAACGGVDYLLSLSYSSSHV
jgi:predicted transposase YbfD/YdcC